MDVFPATAQRWNDLEALFGKHGVFGCWCTWWRLKKNDWDATSSLVRKNIFKGLVESGRPPGLIAYDGEKPVGWISLAPRSEYPRLEKSRVAKPVDDQPVWSIVCFFVEKSHRCMGVSLELLKAAISFAKAQGAKILEAYPNEVQSRRADPWVYMGLSSTFRKAGFVEIAQRSETRLVMRYYLEQP